MVCIQSQLGLEKLVQQVIRSKDMRRASALLPHMSDMPEMFAAAARQRMCLALGMHADAAQAALDAARVDQQAGAYKVMLQIAQQDCKQASKIEIA